jgi:tetratricopeptide (TPR) repeat protein
MQDSESTDRTPTLVQGSTPPPDAQAMVERLRSEALESEKERKALLLHEAGELAERVTGDEVAAAKDYLSAYGADDTFCEPLEALVRILERRRSLRNLGRVLESLVKSARTPEEKARALRARAIEALTIRNKPEEAHSFLLEAVSQCPEDATSWMMLERDGAVRGDAMARMQALAKRVEMARDPEWACLLRLDYARILAQTGETELALQNLTEAAEMPAQGAFRACELGLRFAEQAGLAEKAAFFAKQLAAIVLEGESGPRGRGVPNDRRGSDFVVEALLQAATAYRVAGLVDDEIESIEFALEHDPSNVRAAHRRLDALLRADRTQDAIALATQLLEQNSRPELALHLHTILIEAALNEGNRERALWLATSMNSLPDYARSTADSLVVSSLVPRLLLLDLLLDGARPAEWCQAVEQEAR